MIHYKFGAVAAMKSWILITVRKFGYEIRKAPLPNFESAHVFDLAIHYLLATRGVKLTFIEVGANDGEFGDPLRKYIVKYPWKGVLIEPQPDVFERLKVNYAGQDDRISFESVAISSNPGPIPLYRLPANSSNYGEFDSCVASSNQQITAKQLGVKLHELEKLMVPTARLDDIVTKHHLNFLDILQLDTEGFDWEVLQTLDLTKTRPLLVRFEHSHLSPKAIGRMTQHLNAHNYLVNYGGRESDSIALRRDFIES
jgi:FkbM family methyltransferase